MSVIKMFKGITFHGDDYTELPKGKVRAPAIHKKDLDALENEMLNDPDSIEFYGGQLQVISIDPNFNKPGAETLSADERRKGMVYTFGLIPYDKNGKILNEKEARWILKPCPHGNIKTYENTEVTGWEAIVSRTAQEYAAEHPDVKATPAAFASAFSKLIINPAFSTFSDWQNDSDSDIFEFDEDITQLQKKGLYVSIDAFEQALAENGLTDLSEEELVSLYNLMIIRPDW